jgi:hypothetical protein
MTDDPEYLADCLDSEADRMEKELNRYVREEGRAIKALRAKAALIRSSLSVL